MGRARRFAPVVVAAAGAMALAGCGATSHPSAGAGTRPATSRRSRPTTTSTPASTTTTPSGTASTTTPSSTPSSSTPSSSAATTSVAPSSTTTGAAGEPTVDPSPAVGWTTPQVRPSGLGLSADSTNIITHLTWSTWSASGATGKGVVDLDSCQPTCATGSVTPTPVTVALSSPVHGVFSQLVEQIEGQPTLRYMLPTAPGGQEQQQRSG